MDEQLEQLIALAQSKRSAMGRIQTLTQAQTHLLRADAVEALSENLEAKQRVIDEINRLDDAFQGLYETVKGQMQAGAAPPKDWRTLQACILDIRRTIDAVMALEQENSKLAAQRMNAYQQEIQAQKQSRKAVRGYQVQGGPEGGFDRKK